MTTSPAELVAGVVERAQERLARVLAIAWLEKHHVYASAADICISVQVDGDVLLQSSNLAGAERLAGRLGATERRDLADFARWTATTAEGIRVWVLGPLAEVVAS